jgi:hypothetical protein
MVGFESDLAPLLSHCICYDIWSMIWLCDPDILSCCRCHTQQPNGSGTMRERQYSLIDRYMRRLHLTKLNITNIDRNYLSFDAVRITLSWLTCWIRRTQAWNMSFSSSWSIVFSISYKYLQSGPRQLPQSVRAFILLYRPVGKYIPQPGLMKVRRTFIDKNCLSSDVISITFT